MKHTFSATIIVSVLLFTLGSCQHAQNTPALPEIGTFQQKALEYLKDKQPALKAENLVFHSLDYSYQPQPTNRKVFDAQGNEHWVTDTSFTQRLNVTFVDSSTRTERVEDGQRLVVSQTFSVQFNQALTACVHVGNGTSTEYLH